MVTPQRTCEHLLQFDIHMRSIRYHLRVIEQDLTLAEKKWKLHYAIDYCDLYRYSFSLCSLLKRSRGAMPSLTERNRFVDKLASRMQLFSGIDARERLILLPPHAVELGIFISSIHAGGFERELQLRKLKDATILGPEEISVLKQVREFRQRGCDNGKEVPKELLEKGVEILSREFRELLFLRLAAAEQGIERIQGLILGDKAKILSVDKLWPDLEDQFTDIDEPTVRHSKWFEMFQDIRTKWGSDLSDAQALLILEKLNEHLIPRKEVALLFSDAPTMARVLNWDLMDRPEPDVADKPRGLVRGIPINESLFTADYRILRTPRTFLYYIMCRGDTRQKTLANIRQKQQGVGEYFPVAANLVSGFREEIAEDCRFYKRSLAIFKNVDPEQCQGCKHATQLERLAEDVYRHEQVVKEFENVQLYLNQQKFLSGLDKMNRERLGNLLDKELSDVVCEFADFVLDNSPVFQNALSKRKEELEGRITDLRSDLPYTWIRSAGMKNIVAVTYKLDKFLRVSGRIKLRNKAIRNVVDKISDRILGNGREKRAPEELLIDLVRLSDKLGEIGYEAELLRAILAYICEDTAFCIEIVKAIPDDCDKELSFGCGYLMCLATNKHGVRLQDVGIVERSMSLAVDFSKKHEKDARAHHLLGIVTIRSFRRGYLKESELASRIEKFKRALELCEERELELVFLNNILYAIYLLSDSEYVNFLLDSGSNLLDRMMKILPMKEWHPSYLDTASCIQRRLAELETDNEKREGFLIKAEQSQTLALDKASRMSVPPSDLALLQAHLKKIKEADQRN